jgi:hypothetical protein
MIIQNLTSCLLGLSLLMALGCGSGKEDRDETWEKQTPEEPSGGQPAKDPGDGSAKPTLPIGDDDGGSQPPPGGGGLQLSGNWASSCLTEPNPHGLVYAFDEGARQWLHGFLFFRDDRCQDQYATRIFGGAFESGEPDEETPELIPMTLHVDSVKLVLLDEKLVSEFNKQAFYGFSDWQVGQAKETMGRRDSDGVLVEAFSNYNFIKVDGDKIYLSDFEESPEKRTKELSPNPLFRR